jgi:hypothetical protein
MGNEMFFIQIGVIIVFSGSSWRDIAVTQRKFKETHSLTASQTTNTQKREAFPDCLIDLRVPFAKSGRGHLYFITTEILAFIHIDGVKHLLTDVPHRAQSKHRKQRVKTKGAFFEPIRTLVKHRKQGIRNSRRSCFRLMTPFA